MDKATNVQAVGDALLELGATDVHAKSDRTVSFHGGYFEAGKGLTLYEPNERIERGIRRAYGEAVVKRAAARVGWQATERQGRVVLRRR
jgi:hypothetical protein